MPKKAGLSCSFAFNGNSALCLCVFNTIAKSLQPQLTRARTSYKAIALWFSSCHIKRVQNRTLYMPKAGLEPARGCPHKILSLARLPISSLRLIQLLLPYYNRNILNFKYYFKKIFNYPVFARCD